MTKKKRPEDRAYLRLGVTKDRDGKLYEYWYVYQTHRKSDGNEKTSVRPGASMYGFAVVEGDSTRL